MDSKRACIAFRGALYQVALVLLIIQACSPARYVPDGQLIMHRNNIKVIEKPAHFTSSDLLVLAQPKSMPHIFGLRPGLWLHYRWSNQQNKGLRKIILGQLERSPIYFDEQLVRNSSNQMRQYLFNIGYFEASTAYTIARKKYKATVTYTVNPGPVYTVNQLKRTIPDTALAKLIEADTAASLLKEGTPFSAYVLDDERDRVTNLLKNHGYYFFSKDFIRFEADSSKPLKTVRLNMRIEPPQFLIPGSGEMHKAYLIQKIYVYPQHQPFASGQILTDTTRYKLRNPWNDRPSQLYFVSQGRMGIKPSTFRQVIQLYEGEPVSIDLLRQTYKGLNSLKIFRASNINFDTTAIKYNTDTIWPRKWINAHIYLQRAPLHAYSVEVEGTNSGGDLGMRGSLVYTNRNLLRGAEIFRLRLNGGIEAQRHANGESENRLFNTHESGLDASLLIPRFVSPMRLRKFARDYLPKTTLSLGLSSQTRPNYDRTMARFNFGYDWMTNPRVTHFFSPASLSSIKVILTPEFEEFLRQNANQRLRNQYSNHLILGMRYSYIYNNQDINRAKDFHFFRLNAESAGNLLSAFKKTALFETGEAFTSLFGIRYAQFVRVDADYRFYKVFQPDLRLVYRAMAGAGLPFGNSDVLPFERSFYAGGANSMRGWAFRQLGPGSYSDTLSIERFGSMQLETNLEFRFPIYSYLKGALFADAGNIWNVSAKDEHYEGVFELNTFYKEIALDAGVGLRLDFSFFVFRLDAAVPLHDPALPSNSRWRFNNIKMSDVVWNFGIGYPF